MLKRDDISALINKWNRYENSIPNLPNSKAKELIKSFVQDLENILIKDDKEEQEAFDKMLEEMSPEEREEFYKQYEADHAYIEEDEW